MPTRRRPSAPSSTCPAPKGYGRTRLPARLGQSVDRWAGSPACRLLLLLVLGYASARCLPQRETSHVLALAGVSFFLLATGLACLGDKLRRQRWLPRSLGALLGTLLLLGARQHALTSRSRQLDTSYLAGDSLVACVLSLHPLGDGRVSYDLCPRAHPEAKLRLSAPPLTDVRPGDSLTVRGGRWLTLQRLSEEDPQRAEALLTAGYSALGRATLLSLSPSPAHHLLAHPQLLLMRLESHLRERLASLALAPETQALLAGLVLGDLPRDNYGRELRGAFVAGGVAHLLAVSGFHLAVLMALLSALLRALPGLRRRQRLRGGLVILGAWLFAGLTGASIPTLRAAGMLTLYLGGRTLGRPVSFPEVLALPALIQLLLHPASLTGASFLLTYGAMLGIYLFYRPLRRALGPLPSRLTRTLGEMTALTGAVLPFVLPLSLYLFGQVSLAFPWTTFVALPLASLLIPLGGVLFLLLGCALPVPSFFLSALDLLSSWLVASTRWVEALPALQLHFSLSGVALLGYFALLLLLLIYRRSREEKRKIYL